MLQQNITVIFQVNDACEDNSGLANFYMTQDNTLDQYLWINFGGEEISIVGFLFRNIRNNGDGWQRKRTNHNLIICILFSPDSRAIIYYVQIFRHA